MMKTRDKLAGRALRNIAAGGGEGRSQVRRKRMAALRRPYAAVFAVIGEPYGRALKMLCRERLRQVEEEGWTFDHDETVNMRGELALAARCYLDADRQLGTDPLSMPREWPWSRDWWKPCVGRGGDDAAAVIRETVKAGALLMAEVDRTTGYGGGSLQMIAGAMVRELRRTGAKNAPSGAWQRDGIRIIDDAVREGVTARGAARAAACAALALAGMLRNDNTDNK